jgi:hypothetical protein
MESAVEAVALYLRLPLVSGCPRILTMGLKKVSAIVVAITSWPAGSLSLILAI